MADVQVEHGYTRVANALLEAIIAARMPAAHKNVLQAVLRATYGFNRKAGIIAKVQLVRATGHSQRTVDRALRDLERWGVLLVQRREGRAANRYQVVKDFDQWSLGGTRRAARCGETPQGVGVHPRSRDHWSADHWSRDHGPGTALQRHSSKTEEKEAPAAGATNPEPEVLSAAPAPVPSPAPRPVPPPPTEQASPRGPDLEAPAAPQQLELAPHPDVDQALALLGDAVVAYRGKQRPTIDARRRAAAVARLREHPDRGVAVLAEAAHGYWARHREPATARFDPRPGFTVDTILSPQKFAGYLDAYREATWRGEAAPFGAYAVRTPPTPARPRATPPADDGPLMRDLSPEQRAQIVSSNFAAAGVRLRRIAGGAGRTHGVGG